MGPLIDLFWPGFFINIPFLVFIQIVRIGQRLSVKRIHLDLALAVPSLGLNVLTGLHDLFGVRIDALHQEAFSWWKM
jgi:hypothetical protein